MGPESLLSHLLLQPDICTHFCDELSGSDMTFLAETIEAPMARPTRWPTSQMHVSNKP